MALHEHRAGYLSNRPCFLLAVLSLLISGAGCRQLTPRVPPLFGDPGFWRHWGDGQAEVAAYDLTFPRYGELRRGVAVAIFVTEPFSERERVKLDGAAPGAAQVLKMNLVQDFATGVYDYNLMTSVFVWLAPRHGRPAGYPAKISFSSQEWCGHVYEQLLFDASRVRFDRHSYYQGEADRRGSIRYPSDGLAEDALLMWARGLCEPRIAAGQVRETPVLAALQVIRLRHEPLEWVTARLERSAEFSRVEVPAGSFDAQLCTAILPTRTWRIWVEPRPPRRVLQWECSDGTRGQLLGSERMKYWEMSGPNFDDAVRRIGLTPRLPRMP